LSSSRIVTDSPSTVGSVATRTSSRPSGGGGAERDAAVLRLPALGDVELREHLEPRRHADRHPLRDSLQLVEHAVDAEADYERVVLRLEVDVACTVLGRLEDDRVDEPYEWRIRDPVVGLEIVGILVHDLQLVRIAGGRSRAEGLRGAGESLELGGDVVVRGDVERDLVLARQTQLVDAVDVLGIGDRDAEHSVVVERKRDSHDPLEHVQRHRRGSPRSPTPDAPSSTRGSWWRAATILAIASVDARR
jgi:hypothetical protein